MHLQYDLTTKKGVAYHYFSEKRTAPEDFVLVTPADEEAVKEYLQYTTVDDSDPLNKTITIPADVGDQIDLAALAALRQAEGSEIVSYLSAYLNEKAKIYGYDNYHSAMIYKGSSVSKFNIEGTAFFDCSDAIWSYLETNKSNFEATGEPNLETVKLEHPKLSDYGLTL